MSDDEETGPTLSREEEAALKKEKAIEELKEYNEMRREEKEKEAEEIKQLRERREARKKDREEEERRLSELRAVEEQRRRAEEEERGRKKREEEQRRRDERERKKQEAEEKSSKAKVPNFVITKKHDANSEDNETETKEVAAKSKDQLEAERRAILDQRIKPLAIEGFSVDQLKDKAKELYDLIYRLESDKYDLEQCFQQQAYEMTDLAERARQMNKGGKGNKANVQAEPDPMASKISGIPPKICMYSQYERVKDRRSFGERQTMYRGPLYGEEYVRILPTMKVVQSESGFVGAGDYEAPAPKSSVPGGPTAEPSNGTAEPAPPAPAEEEEEIVLELDDE